ncbi:MAG: hydroxyacid dehydrogenase [Geminicoccaceae bacterium]|nr:hydroxyacid dehydrogenase [Geminicoccaceae bacterium]
MSFRVALSGDFRKPDGSPAYPMFDLSPLENDPRIEVVHVDAVDGAIPASALEDIDALILLVPRFSRGSVPKSGRLAIVARFGVGFDSVDVDACTDNGIVLCTTPDGVRRPVAVAILTFILALAGRLKTKDTLVRKGPSGWAQRSEHMGTGLVGRTLGQLGIGNIGAEVFRIAEPLGMHFIAYDPYADETVAKELGIELVDLGTLFREADFLSVSCPLTEETRGIVNAERLALMKPTAFLINTSRGPTVDQKALYDALRQGRIAGAGLDVFEVEPTAAGEPITQLDNVLLAPHALCWTDQCFAGIGAADVEAVLAVSRGEIPRGIVNRDVVDSETFRARLARYR